MEEDFDRELKVTAATAHTGFCSCLLIYLSSPAGPGGR